MFKFFKSGAACAGLLTLAAGSAGVWAQTPTQTQAQPAQASEAVLLPLTAKQQASLGIQVIALRAAERAPLLATATVVTPPSLAFTVTAPYPGQVSRVWVAAGDTVKAGAALAQFTSPLLGDARRLLNEAMLDYKNTSAAAQRDQAMYDEGIIPAVRLQLSRSRQEAAQALLHAREAELSAAGIRFEANAGYATGTLKAPLTATVVETQAVLGQRVEAGAVLFKLADDRQLQLDIQLSSDKATQLQVGDTVHIASRNAQAQIIGVSRAVDASQSAHARATVTRRGSLQVGDLLSVTLAAKGGASTTPANAPTPMQWRVPTRALTQWRGQSWVFVKNDKGFEAKSVSLRASSDDESVMVLPLPAGRYVAITGIASLRALLQKDE